MQNVIKRRLKIAFGTYTGDGTVSQTITGIGLAPLFLQITEQKTTSGANIEVNETTPVIIDDDALGICVGHIAADGHATYRSRIITLGADSFTVDDNAADEAPNKDTIVYNYMAIGY